MPFTELEVKKPLVEQCLKLNAKNIKEILLGPRCEGELRWGDNSCIGFKRTVDNRLILRYRCSVRGSPYEPVTERILIELKSCNYGGKRAYLHCPDCGRRVLVLYQYGARFLCRQCHNPAYLSTRQSDSDRLSYQGNRVAAKLDLESCWDYNKVNEDHGRPKHMHKRTFRRLRDKARDYYLASMLAVLGKRGRKDIRFRTG
jgi:hypothetical protein